MWITLPRYLSVIAKRFSQPQGFLTISDKLAQPELLFERCQQLIDPLLRGRLAVDPDQRFGPGEADQHPAAVLQVVLEAVIGAQWRPSPAPDRATRAPAISVGGSFSIRP